MSDIKKKINDLKNIIHPYKKQFSDWYKKDKNVKKCIEVISPYKNKFFDFYKKSNKNKNIVRVGGAVLILILGKGLLIGGNNWSREEKNIITKNCLGGYNIKSNSGKFMKKYCECNSDYLSKQTKFNDIKEEDEYASIAFCKHHITGERFENAIRKDMGL
tara:strand:- start:116 stop:595 length:480 start_codon:yes stop_codon:yes gene_type:complete